MDSGANKTPAEVIKKVHLEEHISETSILVLTENGKKSHEKNFISLKILIRSITARIIMMLVSINMVLNAEYR